MGSKVCRRLVGLENVMKMWAILALLFFPVPHTAQTVDATFEHLTKVRLFAFGGVGYSGVTSLGEKDYKALLSRPSAMADFEKLYSSGNLMAKCYALVGIRRLSPQRFRTLAQPLRNSKEEVATMHGCLMSHEPLGAIINQIESGRYSD
jgi:hypothetical protein